MGASLKAAKASLHLWEEPCISYRNGAGTIFFSGCNLHCVYCQNNNISSELFGTEISKEQLIRIYLNLQEKGADNIELVTPTHFIPDIIESLDLIKHYRTTLLYSILVTFLFSSENFSGIKSNGVYWLIMLTITCSELVFSEIHSRIFILS